MTVHQISVFLENRAGQLSEITQVLADNAIDMRAISIAETADYGVLRLIVDQPQKATTLLLEHGFILSMTPVTVVAVPAGAGERPLPDRRFLAAVQAWLDRLRPIGTRVKVIPPVYVELTVRVSLRGSEDGVERTLEEALRSFLEGCGIGGVLRAGDIAALVQAAPGVLQVRRVDLRTTAPGCYQNADGDIRLPRQAIPRLRELQVERLPVERIGH